MAPSQGNRRRSRDYESQDQAQDSIMENRTDHIASEGQRSSVSSALEASSSGSAATSTAQEANRPQPTSLLHLNTHERLRIDRACQHRQLVGHPEQPNLPLSVNAASVTGGLSNTSSDLQGSSARVHDGNVSNASNEQLSYWDDLRNIFTSTALPSAGNAESGEHSAADPVSGPVATSSAARRLISAQNDIASAGEGGEVLIRKPAPLQRKRRRAASLVELTPDDRNGPESAPRHQRTSKCWTPELMNQAREFISARFAPSGTAAAAVAVGDSDADPMRAENADDGGKSMTRTQNTLLAELKQLSKATALKILPAGNPALLFIAEIVPQSFHKGKRDTLLNIFQNYGDLIPPCISLTATGAVCVHKWNSKKSQCSSESSVPLGRSRRGWPSGRIPLEVFESIAAMLPADSLKQMRLVNKEFEWNISSYLFSTVVVPFREDIYGMMLKAPDTEKSSANFKSGLNLDPPTRSANDGMRMFRAWGSKIRKFGMAFEVDESMLEHPPAKGKFEELSTFWGRYQWPHRHYRRFDSCEALEMKADESKRMSEALSNLTSVKELALSIDNGLGWLNGSDISDRARLFKRKPEIFGSKKATSDAETAKQEEAWQGLRHRATMANSLYKAPYVPSQEENGTPLIRNTWTTARTQLGRIPKRQTETIRPLIFDGVDFENSTPMMYTSYEQRKTPFGSRDLIPKHLTPAQLELLLETEWAQRAFLASFCMSLCDNEHTFRNVTNLKFAKISSRYLPVLERGDIWNALQQLECLTINVSADWRAISKYRGGWVESISLKPSGATEMFNNVLKRHVAGLKRVKTLSIGYVGGGEHQTGIFGRNQGLLPAPICKLYVLDACCKQSQNDVKEESIRATISLPHVQHLTISNCWFIPRLLKNFVQKMTAAGMKTLTLNSVSLTGSNWGGIAEYVPLALDGKGRYNTPQGPAREGDRLVGDFFENRIICVDGPRQQTWVSRGERIDSWGDVINHITPGAYCDLIRYAYNYYEPWLFDKIRAERPDFHNLERITFESCGYVKLCNYNVFQTGIVEPLDAAAFDERLALRYTELRAVSMLVHDDQWLGHVATDMLPEDRVLLEAAFSMRFGWLDSEKSHEVREDGQPPGGSGRFSGSVDRLVFDEEEV